MASIQLDGDFDKSVFTFDLSGSQRAAWLDTSELHPGYKVISCATCGETWMMPPSRTLRRVGIEITRAGSLEHLKGLGVGLYLASNAFEQVCRKAKLRGFRFLYPSEVEIKGDGKTLKDTRHQLMSKKFRIMFAAGDGGSSVKINKRRLKKSCERCGFAEYSWIKEGSWKIDKKHWDGSDYFRVREDGPGLLTQRAALAVLDARLPHVGVRKWGVFV